MNYKYILLVVVLVALMYFTMIRPQNKSQQRKYANLEKLKVGDRIITVGGFYASIVEKNKIDCIIAMEPDGVRMRISPRAIAVFPDEIEKVQSADKDNRQTQTEG